ncbi:MAG: UDP-N-acetylmuramyl-tripeptide synthetase [Lachnospiraceae bacterium]|nr:UDP-N-acetylmuramyl-tripeptide synthetase [Lachnospiraceae bacterium]
MLKENLLEGIVCRKIYEGTKAASVEVTGVTAKMDHRRIIPGDLYVCVRGVRFDSHTVICDVIRRGAALVVIEEDQTERVLKEIRAQENGDAGFAAALSRVTVVSTDNVRKTKALLIANYYDHPERKMKMIALTGSKGKTTTTHMISEILNAADHKCGSVGSSGAIVDGQMEELPNSTPDSDELFRILDGFVKAGCECAVVECSSAGIMMDRIAGITFDYALFLNIVEGDHISPIEHKSFEEYLHFKSMLMDVARQPIVCYDSQHLDAFLAEIRGRGIKNTVFFGTGPKPAELALSEDEQALFYADNIYETSDRFRPMVHMDVYEKDAQASPAASVDVNFPGLYQVGNAMAAITVTRLMGVSYETIIETLSRIHVPGRLDMVYQSTRFSVCVDFAHNGYSTRNLLVSLRHFLPKRLVCIFSADGNRALSRRFEMGEASGRLADLSIVTSGHNRYETFENIFLTIAQGLKLTKGNYVVIPNRKKAIRYAIEHVQEGDLIAIIDLGQETYQEINGKKIPYSDTEFVKKVIAEVIPPETLEMP